VETPAHTTQTWRFGMFEVDAREGRLLRAGIPVRIREQSFRILVLLLEHAGELVTRDQLRAALWPSDTFVDFEHGLNTAVMKLREALDDSAEAPLYIETIPKRGYRFIAPLPGPSSNGTLGVGFAFEVPIGGASEIESKESPPAEAKTRTFGPLFWSFVGLGATALAALLIGAVLYLRRPLPPPKIIDYVRLTLDGWHKSPAGADANRLYLNIREYDNWAGVVSFLGGEVTRLSFDVPNPSECGCLPYIRDVSPDGTRLLVTGKAISRDESEIWNVESSGRSGHYLTQAETRYPYTTAWSPDGKQVLFSNRKGDLLVVPSEGGASKLLLPSLAGESTPAWSLSWSPDGRRIRFVRSGKYWEMSSSGSNVHRLLQGWDDSTLACCGTWTPSGDFFFFLAGNTPEDVLTRGPVGQIWALDERRGRIRPAAAGPIRLTDGPNLWSPPVVSRDGKQIFSKQTTLRSELVHYDSRSKQYQPILVGASADLVTFSPDGKYAAYVTFPDGVLWRAKLDGTERIQLTSPPFRPNEINWSPDGSRILFMDDSSNSEIAIYSVASQGGTPVRLIPEDPRPQVDPTWSPDGKRVAYCTDTRFSKSKRHLLKYETHLLDLASHKDITLPPLKDGFFSPRWSPDGRMIVGMTFSPPGLALFDLHTRQYRRLLQVPEGWDLGWNTWSHDSRYVYFFLDGLMRVPISGGHPERLLDLSGFQFGGRMGMWFGLDPQDAPILVRDRGTQEIYALTLEQK
jgi:Tol biopolymer transport system component/DNA-binding winged helix-turn-helix (wHTH) protein